MITATYIAHVHVQLCPTLLRPPWTVAYQALLSIKFSRQAYWSGLPFLLQGIFLTQGSNPGFPHCRPPGKSFKLHFCKLSLEACSWPWFPEHFVMTPWVLSKLILTKNPFGRQGRADCTHFTSKRTAQRYPGYNQQSQVSEGSLHLKFRASSDIKYLFGNRRNIIQVYPGIHSWISV